MRLIDADALKETINTFFDAHFVGCVSNDLITYAKGVDGIIDNTPTVNPTFKPICEVNIDKEELQRMVDEKAKEIVKELGSEDDAIQYTKGYKNGNCIYFSKERVTASV